MLESLIENYLDRLESTRCSYVCSCFSFARVLSSIPLVRQPCLAFSQAHLMVAVLTVALSLVANWVASENITGLTGEVACSNAPLCCGGSRCFPFFWVGMCLVFVLVECSQGQIHTIKQQPRLFLVVFALLPSLTVVWVYFFILSHPAFVLCL